MSRRAWTAEEVRALGVVTDLVTAGAVFGIGRTKAREMARCGDFPVPVVRLGAQYRVPTAPILRALSIDPPDSDAGPATGPATATNYCSTTAATTPPALHLAGTTEGARSASPR